VLFMTGMHHLQSLQSPQLQRCPMRSFETWSKVCAACSGRFTERVHGMHHACMILMHVDRHASSARSSPASRELVTQPSSSSSSAWQPPVCAVNCSIEGWQEVRFRLLVIAHASSWLG
jgi:hypothetical protein